MEPDIVVVDLSGHLATLSHYSNAYWISDDFAQSLHQSLAYISFYLALTMRIALDYSDYVVNRQIDSMCIFCIIGIHIHYPGVVDL